MKLKCWYCQNEKTPDYKEFETLQKFITDRGKITVREKTGVCYRHQRLLSRSIKQARHLALLPFVN